MAGTKSRGFFFTVMALALLSFMLLTVQVWVRTFQQYDQRAVQRFKGEAVQQILSVVSDKSISEFANASAFFATYRLADYSSTANGPLPEWTADYQLSNPYTGAVEQSLRQLMLNGTAPAGPPELTGLPHYSDEEYASYTIESWQKRMRTSAGVMGFNLNFSDVRNFTVRQLDPWTVGVHFEIGMNITDFDGTMFQSRNLTADSNFTIDGFADPLVRRRSAAEGHVNVERQIFRSPTYSSPGSVWPESRTGLRGAGWFFGAIRENYPGQNEDNSSLSQFILVMNRDDPNLTDYMNFYGAVVVLGEPVVPPANETLIDGCRFSVEKETECINCIVRYRPLDDKNDSKPNCKTLLPDPYMYNTYSKPYLVVGGTNSLPLEQVSLPTSESYLLIDNGNDNAAQDMNPASTPYYHRAWDVTSVRDMAICGLYVHAAEGPSFFQRMVGGQHSSTTYGIESFVIGQWAGGADEPASDHSRDWRSRLDWEFYSGQGGGKVKGMMGCKNADMCAGDAARTESVGHFRLTQASADRYGLKKISCDYSDDTLHSGCG